MAVSVSTIPQTLSRAFAFHQAGHLDQAEALYRSILAADPRHTDALTLLGTLALQRGQWDVAANTFSLSLRINPRQPDAWVNLGNAQREMQQLDAALGSFQQALALKPDYAQVYLNLGNVLRELSRFEEALIQYDRAVALMPDYADAYSNRGVVHGELRHPEQALADLNQAIALCPDHADAHWAKGLHALQRGDYAEGWALYEWRWRLPQFQELVREARQPLWSGKEDLRGKRIVLHGEQGLGDVIQFCRYAPLVAALGAQVILEVPPTLRELLGALPGVAAVVPKTGAVLPAGDYHCPLMSLPLAFGTRIDTVPATVPYLFADPALRASWQSRLGPRARPRIGITWAGSTLHAADAVRSLSAAQVAPLFDAPYDFHCLQKEVREQDRSLAPRVQFHDTALASFADTAALVAEMDLVIAVDTSVAHLAGALGKPVWLLSRYAGCWRWLRGREDSPWYPTLRVFHQKRPADWEGVVDKVGAQLAAGSWGAAGAA